MKHISKIKRKVFPKSPKQPISPEPLANPAAGSSSLQPEQNAGSEGGLLITIEREISPDLTMVLDKRGSTDLRIVPQGGVTGDKEVQEVPAPEAGTPGAVIDDAEDGSNPISECSNPSDWNRCSHE